MKTHRTVTLISLVTLTLLSLAGCGNRAVGHGVILWLDSDLTRTGQVVTILEISSIQNSYIISFADGTREMLPQWRIRFFETSAAAQGFAEKFAPYTGTFVRSERNALPVRTTVDRASRAVYRLREGEEVKVLDRTPEPTNEAGLIAHWYQVLTEDGTSGWVFGYYLTPFQAGEEAVARVDDEDPLIRTLRENEWRPASYGQMIRNNTIDLGLLRPEYGLFSDPEENRFRLILPGRTLVFEYTDIVRSASRQYSLQGSSLQVSFRGDTAITIQYVVDTSTESADFEVIPADLSEVRQKEIERRAEAFATLLEGGDRWVSSAYGRINLSADGRFEWSGYDSFVPTAIPRGAGATGTVEFSIFLAPTLRANYDGVISFRFSQLEGRPVHFVFNLTDTGMRLTYVPQQNISRNILTSIGTGSIVAFFSTEQAE